MIHGLTTISYSDKYEKNDNHNRNKLESFNHIFSFVCSNKILYGQFIYSVKISLFKLNIMLCLSLLLFQSIILPCG
jgi:hypothetical protein